MTEDSEKEALIEALRTRGAALRLAFVVAALLAVSLLVSLNVMGGLRSDLSKNRGERQQYQAEERFLDCFLARDDVAMASPSGGADAVIELCEGYQTLDEALKSEQNRQNGK